MKGKWESVHLCHVREKRTGGSDDRFDVCMFGESFQALFFSHVENYTLFDQVVHLHTVTNIRPHIIHPFII